LLCVLPANSNKKKFSSLAVERGPQLCGHIKETERRQNLERGNVQWIPGGLGRDEVSCGQAAALQDAWAKVKKQGKIATQG
jgi:hypothetical protein